MMKKIILFLSVFFISFFVININNVNAGYLTCKYKSDIDEDYFTAKIYNDISNNIYFTDFYHVSARFMYNVDIVFFKNDEGELYCPQKMVYEFWGNRVDGQAYEFGCPKTIVPKFAESYNVYTYWPEENVCKYYVSNDPSIKMFNWGKPATLTPNGADYSHLDDENNPSEPDIPDLCKSIFDSDFGKYLKDALNFMRFLAPIFVLVFTTIDFIKALVSQDKDILKKASSNFVKRLIIAVSIFFVTTIIYLLLGFVEVDCKLPDELQGIKIQNIN